MLNVFLYFTLSAVYLGSKDVRDLLVRKLPWKIISNDIKKYVCSNKNNIMFSNREFASEIIYYLRKCNNDYEYISNTPSFSNYYHMNFPFRNSNKYIYISDNLYAMKDFSSYYTNSDVVSIDTLKKKKILISFWNKDNDY